MKLRIALRIPILAAFVATTTMAANDFTSLDAAHEAAVQEAWDAFAAAHRFAKANDRKSAIAQLEDGLDVLPNELRMQVLLASLLELDGRPADALKRWKHVARTARDPEDKAHAEQAVARLREEEGKPTRPRLTHSWSYALDNDRLTPRSTAIWCRHAEGLASNAVAAAGLDLYGMSACNCNPNPASPELSRCTIFVAVRARDPL